MNGRTFLTCVALSLAAAVLVCPLGQERASAAPTLQVGPNGYYIPDYMTTPNWANSPPLRKFVDGLPGLNTANNLGQMLPVAEPDTTTYPGSDYYEIELVQFREQMHSDLPAVVGDKMTATSGGTLLRGYRQTNTANPNLTTPHYLGPIIVAQKDRPVRIKFTNSLPTGTAGNLFVPVDTTIMGSGPFEIDYNPTTKLPTGVSNPGWFSDTRADLHLHGGMTPWISDGTPHQWITPAGETDPSTGSPTTYPKGMSVEYVPDMWFDAGGNTIAACAKQTTCGVAGATNNPGPGAQTYYYTNQQSARLLFYHDHAWGTTRLNVYVGMAAGYLIQDAVEQALETAGTIPSAQIPLIIQDKTFVDASTVMTTDPTWAWGSNPAKPATTAPVTGDLWWPHVYMPAQNPFDLTGAAPFGRWVYGPYFFPPTPVCGSSPDAVKPFCINFGPVTNPYFDPACDPTVTVCQTPEIPGTPNPSWGAEAFMDTMVVNGTAFPFLDVAPQQYRLRILNAAHDRFVNLQLYVADPTLTPFDPVTGAPNPGYLKEVKMVPAAPTTGFPETWPTDGREGGVPDPATRGPAMIQIGTESGFLAAPVLLNNQPVNWNADVTTFNAGNVLQQNEGGGTLMLGPAERADVIVDFSQFAGKTLILYNDAPAPWPALDPHYDYYTGAPDRTDMGGYTAIPPGVGPNIRTVMQIKVSGSGGTAPPDAYNATTLANLQAAFASTTGNPGVFAEGQEQILVGQAAYNGVYTPNATFPATYPNWGIARIQDDFISYEQVDGTIVSNKQMKRKAIQDEMGEVFDDYGRMSAKLGLEVPFTNGANQNFILQNFVDPPTELIHHNEVQIWRITHNGVDTHPVHFHIFDVQVLNRVGWDGFIRLPDPNELGWKDTVKVSPLEDTIVALRPKRPVTPFAVPNSVRPLNPARPLGDMEGFSQIDITDGGNLTPLMTNKFFNFGTEYVWHCHILSHEENDMMRNVKFVKVPQNDFNGLGRTDVAVWRPSTGQWLIRNPIDGTSTVVPFGSNGDKLVPGDYDGDNKSDVAIFRPNVGRWAITLSSTGTTTNTFFGSPTDIPVPGDYDGDGTTDIAVFRPSNGSWTVQMSATGTTSKTFWGSSSDIPVPGDYDADGKTDHAIYRPSSGTWSIKLSSTGGTSRTSYGSPADIPVPGDYDGDHKNDIAIYRPGSGAWKIIPSSTGVATTTSFGSSTDVPVPGDYLNLGRSQIAIWRPSTGAWRIINPITNQVTNVPFGSSTDKPVKTGQPIQ